MQDDDFLWSFVPYSGDVRPEWMVLGKRHADRAKQFKPFAALRGYEEKVQAVIDAANEPKDGFSEEGDVEG